MKCMLLLVVALFGYSSALGTSCANLKAQGATSDGDYEICIGDRRARVYCQGMDTEDPKEYIPLHEPNHAMNYGPRQRDGWLCNGPLRSERYGSEGHTTFNAVRLNLETMEVIRDDFLFSSTTKSQVPYGRGGDCYSWANCPQGNFQVDLTGTDFHIHPDITWKHEGWQPSWTGLAMSADRKVASATCGGWCGHCAPENETLILAVDDNAPDCCDEHVSCQGTWKCAELNATLDFNFATCVNEECGCKEGFEGCGNSEYPCQCNHQVVYVGNEAFCVPPGACKGANWHCQVVTEQFDFVECDADEGICKCKDGFSPEFPTVDNKCKCEGTLIWQDSQPICQH